MATFGSNNTDDDARADCKDIVVACKFQMGATNGTGDSISVYVIDDGGIGAGGKIKCALYDASLNIVTNGITEEDDMDSGESLKWYTMNFNPAAKPSLTASAWYYIAVWCEDAPSIASLSYDNSNGSGIISDNQTYSAGDYVNFPDPHANDSTVDADAQGSIYCTYTEDASPPVSNPLGLMGSGKLVFYGGDKEISFIDE